jgi:O-antigen/teichoic acid export membrane protein
VNTERGAVRQNVVYSLLDFAAPPLLMIVAAPVLLKALGAQQYGVWMLVNSVAATAGGLGGGVGDAATRFISMYHGRGDHEGVVRSLLASLAINGTLGLLLAISTIVVAPFLFGHVFRVGQVFQHDAIVATRIGAVILCLRFPEAVFVSALRAHQYYRRFVLVSVISRVLLLGSTITLSINGFGLVAILLATLATGLLSFAAQAASVARMLKIRTWRNANLRIGVREIAHFGIFTWLKSALGVLFGYADRLLIAAVLGPTPLAYYTLCSQITQPIPTALVYGFNFLFPTISSQSASGKWEATRRSYRNAVLVSATIVVFVCVPMIVAARHILTLWLGSAVANNYHGVLVALVVGNGLVAISIVPLYGALALGHSRELAAVNLVAGVVSLSIGYVLMRNIGIVGVALAKVIAGLVLLTTFAIVRKSLAHGDTTARLSEPELPAFARVEASR